MDINTAMLLCTLPKLDLHGVTSAEAKVYINDFINDSIIQGIEYIEIIHGIGTGVIKNTTYEELKNNKKVIDYKSHYHNSGCVIVKLIKK